MFCAPGGGGGGGGTSTGAYGGAYAGRTVYQSGGFGCGWHSPVQTLFDQCGSQPAELTADVAIAKGADEAAGTAATRGTNLIIAGLRV